MDQGVRSVFPFVSRIRVHPDIFTMVGVGLSAVAGWAFSVDRAIWAGVIWTFAGLCDLLDGVVARQQGTASRAGAFLDSSMDRLSDLLVLAGIGIAMTRSGSVGGTALVFWVVIGSVMTSYVRARGEIELAEFRAGFMERGERMILLITGAILGWLEVALWLVAIGSTVTTLQRIVLGRRLLHQLDRTGMDPTLLRAAGASSAPAGGDESTGGGGSR